MTPPMPPPANLGRQKTATAGSVTGSRASATGRTAVKVRQADVARAVRGALKAGLSVSRVEVDASGKIIVICGDAPAPVASPADFETRLRSATGWAK